MATRQPKVGENEQSTNGDDVVARGADVPLVITEKAGPRDALTDLRDHDFVPGIEDKGYHVGETRQPAEPVLRASGAVDFETTDQGPTESKFESRGVPMTYAEQIAANDAWQRDRAEQYGGRESVTPLTDPDAVAARKRELDKASRSNRQAQDGGEQGGQGQAQG